jgi:hypothetical protein
LVAALPRQVNPWRFYGKMNFSMNYYNYFTEIEEHFVKRRGKHLLISPMDWALIAAWRDAGVPLQVALRGIDIAMDGFLARKGSGSAKVNSLCYCHDSVMTEYGNHLESRVGESSATAHQDAQDNEEPAKTEVLAFLSARMSEIKALPAKHSFSGATLEALNRISGRLEEILESVKTGNRFDSEALERDLQIVDNLLISELRSCISPEQMAEWENEAKTELKIYRKHLPRETYDKIRVNYLCKKVRQRFEIGELSLFQL